MDTHDHPEREGVNRENDAKHYVVLTIMPDGQRVCGECVYDDVEKAFARAETMTAQWRKAHDALTALAELGDPISALQLSMMGKTCPKFVPCELMAQERVPISALPKLEL